MTSQEFCIWLQGYADIIGPNLMPTDTEWLTIVDQLNNLDNSPQFYSGEYKLITKYD